MSTGDDYAPLRPDDPPSLGDYQITERYNADSSGSIYRASHQQGEALIRVVDRRQIPTMQAADLATERVTLLRELDGLGISAIQQYSWVEAKPWIAVEARSQTSLTTHVRTHGPLRERDTSTLALFLTQVIDAMHQIDVIHGSLRPSSIRISPGELTLADAGLYAPVRDLLDTGAGGAVVDAAWMTPEQMLGGTTTSATDVYLWALIVLYAASGSNPFEAGDARTALTRIRSEIPMVGHVLQEPLASLVTAALAKEPAARPPMSDLVRMLGGQRLLVSHEIDDVLTSSTLDEEGADLVDYEARPEASEELTDGEDEEESLLIEAESPRRVPRWLIWAVIGAVILGAGVGVLVGRLIVGTVIPPQFPQAATVQDPGVAWQLLMDEGV